MQTVDASTILEDAERLIGWDVDQLEDREKAMARMAFSLALQEVWEAWWWEKLMTSAQMNGATVYTPTTTFAADDFCYYPATQKFYQAMQATTGNAPATLDASQGGYATNYAYWAEATVAPSAGDYTASKVYVSGDQVRNPDDGLCYQMTTPAQTDLILTGSTDDGLYALQMETIVGTGEVVPNLYNGKYQYLSASGSVIRWDNISGTYAWQITIGGTSYCYSTDNTTTPATATGWTQTVPKGHTPPTFDLTFTFAQTPPDYGWHALLGFTPAITIAAKVRAVGVRDPRNSLNAGLVEFEETLDGIRIPCWKTGVPWLWYRRPTPIIKGDDFDATATYAATPAAELVFDS